MANHETPARRPTALVTGASVGIGEELARLLSQNGHDVVLVARDRHKLEVLAEELSRDNHCRARSLAVDLVDPATPKQLTDTLQQEGVQVDLLVNNAGFGSYGPFAEMDLAGQLRMIQLNVSALTHLTGLVLPGMLGRRSGRILNVGSTAGFQPGPLMAVYYATKAYVLSFSEALANELEGSGVSVTCLCPGPTKTEFQSRAQMEGSKLVSAGNMMTAADVARSGFNAMMQGRPVVIPGLRNRLMAQSVRLVPRRTVTRIVRNMQERRQH
jgi:short-subunit dehydrogenase